MHKVSKRRKKISLWVKFNSASHLVYALKNNNDVRIIRWQQIRNITKDAVLKMTYQKNVLKVLDKI